MKKLLSLLTLAILSLSLIPGRATAQNNCPAPFGLTSSNITVSSAQLSWTTSTLSAYSILQYRPVGSTTWTNQIVQALPYILHNLNCGTIYEWQVQAVCYINGAQTYSTFSPYALLTTLQCTNTCPAPTNLSVTNTTATGVVLNWSYSSPGTQFNIQYQQSPGTTWNTINNVQGLLYQLGGLTCNTVYVFQVQAVCTTSSGQITLSPWSQLTTFITSACPYTCPAPTALNVTNITATGAVLNWTGTPGTITGQYNLQYQQAGSTTWTTINQIGGNLYQLGGLQCNTTYIFQVQTICINPNGLTTLSAWSAPFTFTTAACPVTCPTPTGLTATNITAGGAVLSWTSVAPAPVSYQLRYRITGTASWTLISNATSPYQLGNLICNTGYDWQVRTVCPSSGTNQVTYSPWSQTHTFSTTACPTGCPAPTGLTATNITTNSAVLSWISPAGSSASYQVRYRIQGTTTWTWVYNASSPTTISNLQCNTIYQWQVRAKCTNSATGVAIFSPWSPLQVFTTMGCNTVCPTPTGLTSTNITGNFAVLSWTNVNPSPGTYQLRYRVTSAASWTLISNATTPYTLGNLVCGTTYEWQVRTVCPSPVNNLVTYSSWSVIASFNTAACTSTCLAPTGLFANVNSQGGLLTWGAVTGALSYNIRYRQLNAVNYTTATSPMAYLQVGNLTPGTAYEWQVQTVCSNNTGASSVSAWSVVNVFTTPILLTVYPNPAAGVVTVEWLAETASRAHIGVRDLFGKTVFSTENQFQSGENSMELDLSSLKEGWYSITVQTDTQSTTTRLMISR